MPPRKKKRAYFNRELSWLAFNRRVLEQAQDKSYPLLERMMFLTFVSSNLDEFFEIRVAGLLQQIESSVTEPDLAELDPKEQLRRIHNITSSLVKEQYQCWKRELVPQLRKQGVVFKRSDELTRRETRWLKVFFEEEIYPVLTPLAIDRSHPFPFFTNKSLNILLWLDDPSTPETETMLAVIPVPRILPRIVQVPGQGRARPCYIFLSDVIKLFDDKLFPGYHIKGAHAFRITRNSDLYIDEEEVENLLQSIEEELYKRRKGSPVRLEIEGDVKAELLEQLLAAIGLAKQHVFRINGPLNLMRLRSVYGMIDRPDLKFKPYIPHSPPALAQTPSIYEVIHEQDYLLHHPYDSFMPVIDFLKHAARDPKVLAIKLTLYRTSDDSPIINALMEAARNDKQVTALIELKARFDEEANIEWAKRMEEAGVHVVYGFIGLKTHSKCILVVRKEEEGLRRYAHLGTGNYNPNTARLYTDLSFMTCREDITEDVAEVFNTLTGFAKSPSFKKLLVAPYNLHTTMQEYILREAKNARAGLPARIVVKCNSLIDKETIDALYTASQAGVKIELIIRGICGLVPGVAGLSETITVRSILGRFLEHSRIFYFENGEGDPIILAGSADWMPRNFYRRIEVVFPVEQPDLRQRVADEILETTLQDTASAKLLQSNGSYSAAPVPSGQKPFSSQDAFMALASETNRPAPKAEN